MKKLTLKAWRDIRTQKWQFLALTMIILVGVTSYGAMTGMIDDVLESIEHTVAELHFHDILVRVDGTVSQAVAEQVALLENVESVTGRLVVDTGLTLGGDERINARLVGMPTTGQPAVDQVFLNRGRSLEAGDGLAAVVDHHLADYYGLEPGDKVYPIVDGSRLGVEVVGIGTSPEYLMAVASAENPVPSPSGFGVLFMPNEGLQQLVTSVGAINELAVTLVDPSEQGMAATAARMEELLGEDKVLSVTRQDDNPSYSLLKLDLEGGREMMSVVPTMFLIVAAMSIYVTLSRMVQAQRPQVGVLKALGYGRRAIMGHYLLYAGVVALVGSLLGFALSYPIGLAFSRAYAAEFGLPFVVARLHLAAAAEAIAFTLVFCVVAAAFPAWRSARMAPAQAIRFDPSVSLVEGSVPLLERLLAVFKPLRVNTKISLRNVFRNRRRTLTTGLGFVFAFVVLLACWSLFDALGYMLDVQFRQTDLWDLHVAFSRAQDQSLVEEILKWPEVTAAEPVIEMPARLETADSSQQTFLTAIEPDTELHHFRMSRDLDPIKALAPGNALISERLAEQLGVATGDQISIKTPLGGRRVEVVAGNEEVMSGGAYVSLSWLREQAGGLQVLNGLLLSVDADQRAAVRKRLYQIPGVASIDLKDEITAGWQSLMGLYYVMMGTFLIFALIIAGAVIFNTMTVNVLEREREIATMRALGRSRGSLRGMITQENLLVGLAALLPGLLLATLVTYYLFQVFTEMSGEFYLPFHIAPVTYVIISVLVFGTALLSQVPAVRRVNRLDLAEATKVMS